jgi:hypothetical protein
MSTRLWDAQSSNWSRQTAGMSMRLSDAQSSNWSRPTVGREPKLVGAYVDDPMKARSPSAVLVLVIKMYSG